MGVFLKTNVMIKILHNLALFRVKNAIFSPIFSPKIFLKIVTSVFRQIAVLLESSITSIASKGERNNNKCGCADFRKTCSKFSPQENLRTKKQGCQIFTGTTYQNGKKCTK
jgi:hypothetical protein